MIRLDFCAGDRPDVLGLGLEVGLLQTLDRSWCMGGEGKTPFICWQRKTMAGGYKNNAQIVSNLGLYKFYLIY